MKNLQLSIAPLIGAFIFGSASFADSKSDKNRETKPSPTITLTIDASKLPPELLKELLKHAGDSKKSTGRLSNQDSGKGKPAWTTPRSKALPPRLAKKSKDHPGVRAFLSRADENKSMPATDSRKKKKKGDDD